MTAIAEEHRSFCRWDSASAPERVLVIRFHAIGDVVATLPACAALRQKLPQSRIDYLTTDGCFEIPWAVQLFDHVFRIGQDHRRTRRTFHTLNQAVRMRRQRYDVVIDLQRHRASRLIRRIARPHAWSEFDRFSPRHALERVLDTFSQAGFPELQPVFHIELKPDIRDRARGLLRENGWNGKEKLVILNPAGFWVTRNWPLQSYVELAELWQDLEPVRFLLAGTNRIADRTRYLSGRLAGCAIDLTGKTSLAEALGVVQLSSVVISEDSGLLHMAWVSGVPTVALFGSTRSDWTRPLGSHSRYVGSEDLPCGACMASTCRFGDVRCLTRHSAREVLRLAQEAERG